MGFSSLATLLSRCKALGAVRVIAKPMAENDNSKQQIYLGGSFEALSALPFTNVREESALSRPNFKAALSFYWIDEKLNVEQAHGAQLILYPDYPEVRLSGFLKGCALAPSADLQHIPAGKRTHNNGPDGRVLFLAVAEDGKIYAWLAKGGSPIAHEFAQAQSRGAFVQSGVFSQLPLTGDRDPRATLIETIREIHHAGWHTGFRLDSAGTRIPYDKRNAAGYTLEGLLGVRPNSASAPDFLGFEIKAVSGSKITLMTPEPNGGFYGTHGVAAFVSKYGKPRPDGVTYFTGAHTVNTPCTSSGQTLRLSGYDPTTGKINNVSGGIQLVDAQGTLSAEWSFSHLINHWGRKHASAAYIPYTKSPLLPLQFHFKSPIFLAEGTTFDLYLRAMHNGQVIYDPGSKVTVLPTGKSVVKARSQFRTSMRHLNTLYKSFVEIAL